jgi:hypothetical protein
MVLLAYGVEKACSVGKPRSAWPDSGMFVELRMKNARRSLYTAA